MVGAGMGVVRLLRALVVLGAIVSLTVGGHVAGGGAVSGFAIGALVLVAWPVVLSASRRQIRKRHLLPALVGGQFAGHGLLDFFAGPGHRIGPGTGLLGGHHSDFAGGSCLSTAGHHGQFVQLDCAATALPQGAGDLAGAAHSTALGSGGWIGGWAAGGLVMLATHVVAAGLIALLLAKGEAVLWRVLDLVLAIRPHLVVPLTAVVRIAPAVRALPSLHLASAIPARGPPAAA